VEAEEALELCESILNDLEELPEEAEDFAASVGEKVSGMQEWIEEKDFVTDKMAEALKNMRHAVDRWRRD